MILSLIIPPLAIIFRRNALIKKLKKQPGIYEGKEQKLTDKYQE